MIDCFVLPAFHEGSGSAGWAAAVVHASVQRSAGVTRIRNAVRNLLLISRADDGRSSRGRRGCSWLWPRTSCEPCSPCRRHSEPKRTSSVTASSFLSRYVETVSAERSRGFDVDVNPHRIGGLDEVLELGAHGARLNGLDLHPAGVFGLLDERRVRRHVPVIRATACSMSSCISSFLFSTTRSFTRPPPRRPDGFCGGGAGDGADRCFGELAVGAVIDALLLARLLLALPG